MSKIGIRALAVLPALLVIAAAESHSARFAVEERADNNRVTFLSKAPLETFEGTTDRITGHLVVDPKRIGGELDFHFEVDLASLDTGKDKRNAHMRERHLETDKYPTATFDGGKIAEGGVPSLVPGRPATFTVEGNFEIHGVSRRTSVVAEVTLSADEGREVLDIVARFEVALEDHDISRPKFLFMKLNEVQQVTVKLRAVSTR